MAFCDCVESIKEYYNSYNRTAIRTFCDCVESIKHYYNPFTDAKNNVVGTNEPNAILLVRRIHAFVSVSSHCWDLFNYLKKTCLSFI